MNSSPIASFGGYRKMFSFGFTCLIYHATAKFCRNVYSYKNDPLGKASGQMIGAARSARQNIVEGSARAGTSTETELRLLDVAKGSLEELAGDYEVFLTENDELVWSKTEDRHRSVTALSLDPFTATDDIAHEFSKYILAMRRRFTPWLENDDPLIAANAILIVIDRAEHLLGGQMAKTLETFEKDGGFRERMHKLRTELRDQVQENTPPPPACPACGMPMRICKAKTGQNAGKKFWGCSDFPNCKAIKDFEKG